MYDPEMLTDLTKQYHSLLIGKNDEWINTWENWHVVPTSRPLVNPPEVATEYVEIPGSDGALDFTEALAGKPIYKTRTGSWEFMVLNGYQDWVVLYDHLLTYLHGHEFDVVLVDDPYNVYHGRLTLNEWRSEEHNSTITIDYTLEPYKKMSSTYVEDWLWDDLTVSGESGYKIQYGKFDVNGDRYRTFYNKMDKQLEFTLECTSEMTVTFAGKTYDLYAGANKSQRFRPPLYLSPGYSEFKFSGHGQVNVIYDRGESV